MEICNRSSTEPPLKRCHFSLRRVRVSDWRVIYRTKVCVSGWIFPASVSWWNNTPLRDSGSDRRSRCGLDFAWRVDYKEERKEAPTDFNDEPVSSLFAFAPCFPTFNLALSS